MGEDKNVTKSRRAAEAATNTLQTGAQDYTSSPEFAQIQSLVNSILQNPLTYGPQDVERIYNQGASAAYQGASGLLDNLYAQAGQTGGFRSGSTRGGEFEVASRLGEGLAGARRAGDLAAAERRVPDTVQAINTGNTLLQNLFALQQSIASGQLGQSQILSGLANVPSPASQIGGGLGGILGSVLTAQAGNPNQDAGLFK